MRLVDVDSINPMRCPQTIAEMREWFNEIPTAYDIDKVVEQLEECQNNCFVGSYEDYDEYEAGKDMAYADAIEIVKKGGVSNE